MKVTVKYFGMLAEAACKNEEILKGQCAHLWERDFQR